MSKQVILVTGGAGFVGANLCRRLVAANEEVHIFVRANTSRWRIKALTDKGIKASIAGELIDKKHGMLVREQGKDKKLEHPRVDPFWNAFYRALQQYKELEAE